MRFAVVGHATKADFFSAVIVLTDLAEGALSPPSTARSHGAAVDVRQPDMGDGRSAQELMRPEGLQGHT
jgi:hypothetical protein